MLGQSIAETTNQGDTGAIVMAWDITSARSADGVSLNTNANNVKKGGSIMKKAIPTMATLPRKCCGRCVWWHTNHHSPWGYCQVHRESRWYRGLGCDVYKRNTLTPDEIPLYLGETSET